MKLSAWDLMIFTFIVLWGAFYGVFWTGTASHRIAASGSPPGYVMPDGFSIVSSR